MRRRRWLLYYIKVSRVSQDKFRAGFSPCPTITTITPGRRRGRFTKPAPGQAITTTMQGFLRVTVYIGPSAGALGDESTLRKFNYTFAKSTMGWRPLKGHRFEVNLLLHQVELVI